MSSLPIPAELCSAFLSFSSVYDIRSWAQTCRYAKQVASHCLQDRYRQEVRRFARPRPLSAMLKHTRSVISGSVALHYLEGAPDWHPHNMDVYAPHSSFNAVVAYFCNEEGYVEIPTVIITPPTDEAEEAGYGRLAGALRVVRLERPGGKVDVVCSTTDAALYPLSFFWGTAVMNYLDGSRVGCAYPQLTFAHLCLVAPLSRHQGAMLSNRALACAEKYTQRGYEVAMSRYGLSRTAEVITAVGAERTFEDSNTFTYDISGDLPPSSFVDDEWQVVWQIGGRLGGYEYSATAATIHRDSGEQQIPYHVYE